MSRNGDDDAVAKMKATEEALETKEKVRFCLVSEVLLSDEKMGVFRDKDDPWVFPSSLSLQHHHCYTLR